MLLTAGFAALLVVLSAFVHYEILSRCDTAIARLRRIKPRERVLVAVAAAFCSHLLQIALFGAAYWLLDGTAMGTLRGQVQGPLASFLYFSAETYTSLGFGDVYPVGDIRLVAGIEALTGLLMISWTASFTYLEMSRHWGVRDR